MVEGPLQFVGALRGPIEESAASCRCCRRTSHLVTGLRPASKFNAADPVTYGVEIRPLLVATIRRFPQRKIDSTLPDSRYHVAARHPPDAIRPFQDRRAISNFTKRPAFNSCRSRFRRRSEFDSSSVGLWLLMELWALRPQMISLGFLLMKGKRLSFAVIVQRTDDPSE